MQIQTDLNTTLAGHVSNASLSQGQSVPPLQTGVASGVDVPKDTQQDVMTSVKSVQKNLDLMKNTSFQLDYDKDIDRVIVKYVSRDTGEVVNQIPSKEFVNFEKEFVKTIGLLFDKTV